MSKLQEIPIPEISGVALSIGPENRLKLAGTIATRDPAEGLAPFFRKVHQAVMEDAFRTFSLDLSELTFVNSSAIRLFIDWVTWVKNENPGQRYKVVITMNPQITWQKTSLGVLKSVAPDVVELAQT